MRGAWVCAVLATMLLVGALAPGTATVPVLDFGVTFDTDWAGQSAGYPYALTCYGLNVVTTPAAPSAIVAGCLGATIQMGTATQAAQGTGITASFAVNAIRVGHPGVESAALLLANRVDLGEGYAFGAPIGIHWLVDAGLHGPIGVQPDGLHGIVSFLNNYYDGSPMISPSAALEVATAPGAGTAADSLHQAAITYPVDVGLLIAGYSSSPGQRGFRRGIQVGGVGTWTPTSPSVIGTGVDIRDYSEHGIYVHSRLAESAAYALVIEQDAGPVALRGLPVYATDAAARTGGLVRGDLYRTGGDPDHVCVVH